MKAMKDSGTDVSVMDADEPENYPQTAAVSTTASDGSIVLDPALMEKVFGTDETGALRKYDIIQNVVVFSKLVFQTLYESEILGLLMAIHQRLNENGFFIWTERLNVNAYKTFHNPAVDALNQGTIMMRMDHSKGYKRPSYQRSASSEPCFEKCGATFNWQNADDGITLRVAKRDNLTEAENAAAMGNYPPQSQINLLAQAAMSRGNPQFSAEKVQPYVDNLETVDNELWLSSSQDSGMPVTYYPMNGRVADDVFEYYIQKLADDHDTHFSCTKQPYLELNDPGYVRLNNWATYSNAVDYQHSTFSIQYMKCTKA